MFQQNKELQNRVKQLETEKSNIEKERDEAKAAIEAWANKYRDEKAKNDCLVQAWAKIQFVVTFVSVEHPKNGIQLIKKYMQESNTDYFKLNQ